MEEEAGVEEAKAKGMEWVEVEQVVGRVRGERRVSVSLGEYKKKQKKKQQQRVFYLS